MKWPRPSVRSRQQLPSGNVETPLRPDSSRAPNYSEVVQNSTSLERRTDYRVIYKVTRKQNKKQIKKWEKQIKNFQKIEKNEKNIRKPFISFYAPRNFMVFHFQQLELGCKLNKLMDINYFTGIQQSIFMISRSLLKIKTLEFDKFISKVYWSFVCFLFFFGLYFFIYSQTNLSFPYQKY